ncbi:hypothetical protein COCOBI_09-0210 [Coccomyxa sp. Obi]|nr:hypothetical protein COCOBI_09-0210 [Coccomyxa sp. Obi]
MVEAVPTADATVHITSISMAPALAGTCSPHGGTCTAVDPETAHIGTAERPTAGNATPDKLLTLLQAAGMGSPLYGAGHPQVQPGSPCEAPLRAEGSPQLWPRSPGRSGEGAPQHERPPQDARNVRRRLI